uniref:Uncharacterized protein n=1 Tax=Morchella brunnea TaxID=1174671 RepID=A0A8K1I7H2_9PEZI|nr:hypothetical protein LK370_mgp216 [Morchella brunnea]UBU98487.1 hypothetical protein [Morchella brunnea]
MTPTPPLLSTLYTQISVRFILALVEFFKSVPCKAGDAALSLEIPYPYLFFWDPYRAPKGPRKKKDQNYKLFLGCPRRGPRISYIWSYLFTKTFLSVYFRKEIIEKGKAGQVHLPGPLRGGGAGRGAWVSLILSSSFSCV